VTSIRTCIVGTKFKGRSAIKAVAELRPGDRVELYREPDNPHDPLAVQCRTGHLRVGYLPRQVNRPIAEAMDGGAVPVVTVLEAAVERTGRIIHEPTIEVAW
jgi:hypothetical protein